MVKTSRKLEFIIERIRVYEEAQYQNALDARGARVVGNKDREDLITKASIENEKMLDFLNKELKEESAQLEKENVQIA